MCIDPQWLKYLSKFREIAKDNYKYKVAYSKVSVEEYNELLSDRAKAVDYIIMLCNDIENILIENADLTNKVKMMEENLIDD